MACIFSVITFCKVEIVINKTGCIYLCDGHRVSSVFCKACMYHLSISMPHFALLFLESKQANKRNMAYVFSYGYIYVLFFTA